MNVGAGFNTAYGREKFDVIIDSTDLGRVLVDAGIDASVADTLGATTVFRLMHFQAQVFSNQVLILRLQSMAKLPNFPSEDKERTAIAQQDLNSNQAALASLLNSIREGKAR